MTYWDRWEGLRSSVILRVPIGGWMLHHACLPWLFLNPEQRKPDWVSGFLAHGLLSPIRELGTMTDEDG